MYFVFVRGCLPCWLPGCLAGGRAGGAAQADAINNTAAVDERRSIQNQYADVIDRPENWTRYFDEESGREFYYNSFTNESTYDRPAAYVSV